MGCSHSIQDKEYSSLVRSLISCTIKISKHINWYTTIYNKSGSIIIKSIIDNKKLHLKALLHIYKLVKGENMVYSPESNNDELSLDSLIIDEFKLIDDLKSLLTLLPYQNLIHGCQAIIIDINTITNKLLFLKQKDAQL